MKMNDKNRMTNDEPLKPRSQRMRLCFVIRFSSFVISLLAITSGLVSAKDGAIQCGMAIYAGTKTSRCFSDEFLSTVQQKTSISTERRFKFVKLGADDLFAFPFIVMTGEGDFTLSQRERENLKKYLTQGGFLLASAGCSNKDWDNAFRREMKKVLAGLPLKGIASTHPLFRTVFPLEKMKLSKSSGEAKLEGVEHQGRLDQPAGARLHRSGLSAHHRVHDEAGQPQRRRLPARL